MVIYKQPYTHKTTTLFSCFDDSVLVGCLFSFSKDCKYLLLTLQIEGKKIDNYKNNKYKRKEKQKKKKTTNQSCILGWIFSAHSKIDTSKYSRNKKNKRHRNKKSDCV
jgi:hypothetical protein